MMSTIYCLVKDGKVTAVAESTDLTTAHQQLMWWPGEIYACRISDTAASEIRAAVTAPEGSVTRGKAPQSPLSMLKMYSQSMTKVADVT